MSCLPRKVRLLLFFQCRKHSHDRTAVYHCGNYLMLLPLQSLFQCLTASLQKCRSGFSAGKSQRSAAVDPCLIRRISGQFCIVLPFKVSEVALLQTIYYFSRRVRKKDLRRLDTAPHGTGQNHFRHGKCLTNFRRFLLCQRNARLTERLICPAADIAPFQIAGSHAVPDKYDLHYTPPISKHQKTRDSRRTRETAYGYTKPCLCDIAAKRRKPDAPTISSILVDGILFQNSRPVSRLRFTVFHAPSRNHKIPVASAWHSPTR